MRSRGESSSGLVMFLAGLVVGAILSTIYYGYTSDNASVGSGLKNLAQVTQKNAIQNGTQDDTQNDTTASATSQNNVSQQTPATAGVATTQSGQQVATDSSQNTASQIAQEVAQNDNAASRTVEEVQQGTKQNYDYYTALQQQQSIPQTEAADPKQEVQAPTTVQVTANAPVTAGQQVITPQQNTAQPVAASQVVNEQVVNEQIVNGANANGQIVSGGQTTAFPVVNTPQTETQPISQSTAQSGAQPTNTAATAPVATSTAGATMVAANTATATSNTTDDGIPMATILTEEQAASMRQSGDKTIVNQGQSGATEVTSLPVISSQSQGQQAAATSASNSQSLGVTQIAKVADPNFPTRGLTPKGQFYMLQVAAYNSFSQADSLKAKLALSGIETLIQRVSTGGKPTYRVRLGPFINYSNLARAEEKLNTLGLVPQKFLQRDAG